MTLDIHKKWGIYQRRERTGAAGVITGHENVILMKLNDSL